MRGGGVLEDQHDWWKPEGPQMRCPPLVLAHPSCKETQTAETQDHA